MVTFGGASLLNQLFRRFFSLHRRLKSTMTNRGLVLGIYQDETNGEFILTKAAQSFLSQEVPGLSKLITRSGLASKKGKSRVFYDQHEEYGGIAVVSLGKQNAGYNELEELDEGRENVRTAVARGVKQLQDAGIKSIDVEPCGDPEAAAEGAFLGTYYYDMLKNEKKPAPELKCYTTYADSADSVNTAWNRGRVFAEGQNFARDLQETPSNHLTPTRFGEIATEKLGKLEGVTVIVRDRAWAEQKKMFSFLSVTNGSDEPPKFVELEYKGRSDNSPPFALVGKGVTFDSGGISIKPSADMDQMRADMGGGACVLASFYTAARLKLPINIKGFIPLTENMPSGKATKPGDVVTSMSGKTIQINNTDAEGRLILCDALTYAQTFNPTGIVDLATLTGAIGVALGSAASGVYTNSSYLWENMHKRQIRFGFLSGGIPSGLVYGYSCTFKAGTRTGDRVWKMPLFKLYAKQMKDAGHLADLNNVSGSRAGGSCTAAAFLKEFVNHDRWMHMDIAASVLDTKNDEVPYLPKGMSGRPTRTVVEFLSMISKH